MEKKFNCKFDIVLAAAAENTDFLDEYKLFIKRRRVSFLTTDKLGLEGKTVIRFKTDEPNIIRKVPNAEEPLTFRALTSFALLLFLVTIAEAREIKLYGADGGAIRGKPLYWEDWPSNSLGRVIMDTRILNQAFPIIMKRACKLYGIDGPEIINMSKDSHYTCFKK